MNLNIFNLFNNQSQTRANTHYVLCACHTVNTYNFKKPHLKPLCVFFSSFATSFSNGFPLFLFLSYNYITPFKTTPFAILQKCCLAKFRFTFMITIEIESKPTDDDIFSTSTLIDQLLWNGSVHPVLLNFYRSKVALSIFTINLLEVALTLLYTSFLCFNIRLGEEVVVMVVNDL